MKTAISSTLQTDAIIRAPQARDRFPSNIVNKADAYILMRKEYDTDSKDKLYSMALSDLKTASEPVVPTRWTDILTPTSGIR